MTPHLPSATALCTLLTLAAAMNATAQMLPADRVTTWRPGVVGGIPERTSVCATLTAASYGHGATDASGAIQAALDACPAEQVVVLSPGTFTVNNVLLIRSSITLRGAGAGVTFLRKTNGARARLSPTQPIDPTTYTYDAQPVIIVGPSRWPGPDPRTSVSLAVDGAKGASSVTLASAAGISPGQFVLLDERSGATWQSTPSGFPSNALVWRGDRVAWNMHWPVQQWQDDSLSADALGPYDTTPGVLPRSMSWFSRTDRPTNEIKEVAAVVGNTVTFTTPLHISYRVNHAAEITRYTQTGSASTGNSVHVTRAGVENFTVSGGADGQIRFNNAAYSWARNIEHTEWLGEGFGVDGSFRIEIRDSYIHHGSWPQPGGAGYAISFAQATSEVLVENNIIIDACKNMVARSSGAGSVFGYNYVDDSWNYDAPGWVEVGLNASHMAGPHHVLFEGNYAHNADSDYTHGNAISMTFFRNWFSGQRRSFTDTAGLRAVGLSYGSWWFSFVGNVLGQPGRMDGWVYDDPAMASPGTPWGDRTIWKLGYDPARWGMSADPQTLGTVIRDGNFDFVTRSVRWHNTPGGFQVPSSLYLTGRPAFFGTSAWPWVDAGTGSVAVLPAKARYDAGVPNATGPVGRAPDAPTNVRWIP